MRGGGGGGVGGRDRQRDKGRETVGIPQSVALITHSLTTHNNIKCMCKNFVTCKHNSLRGIKCILNQLGFLVCLFFSSTDLHFQLKYCICVEISLHM